MRVRRCIISVFIENILTVSVVHGLGLEDIYIDSYLRKQPLFVLQSGLSYFSVIIDIININRQSQR